MSKRGANLVNPENQELIFDNTAIIEFLEKNLAQVLVDTARMKVELEELQKQKQQLLEHRFSCLVNDILHPLPEDMDLLPRLNQVTSKAEELIGQLARLNKTSDQHCKETKSVTTKQLESSSDQDATLSSTDLDTIVVGRKKALKKTVVKTVKKKELANKRKAYHPKHLDMVQKMEALTLVHRNANDFLEQRQQGNALDKADSE